MKNVPDIAPEIRGLLEEIVADPRSMIRLAPRRALRTWFDTGETVRASDVTRTKAERHLVEVHREELAALLCEAAQISYWRAPGLAHRPVGADGKLYNPTEREPDWRRRAEPEVVSPSGSFHGVELLRQCLVAIESHQAWTLAQASLSLVPRDKTRFYVALSVPWSRPRAAIALLNRLVLRARSERVRLDALVSLAARTCCLGLLEEARGLYRDYASRTPQSPCGWICAFNLSCIVGDEEAARAEAIQLGKVATPDNPIVADVSELLREWMKTRSDGEISEARIVRRHISGEVPDTAGVVCRLLES